LSRIRGQTRLFYAIGELLRRQGETAKASFPPVSALILPLASKSFTTGKIFSKAKKFYPSSCLRIAFGEPPERNKYGRFF